MAVAVLLVGEIAVAVVEVVATDVLQTSIAVILFTATTTFSAAIKGG